MRHFPTLVMALLLAGCASDDTLLRRTNFASLPEWSNDSHVKPLQLFAESCEANQVRTRPWQTAEGEPVGQASDWKELCVRAQEVTEGYGGKERVPESAARAFFEAYFIPYHVTSEQAPVARITGYYEPMLRGSLRRTGPYQTPVYGMPSKTCDVPPTRAEIDAGALIENAPVLLYVDDPVALFFLHIQGSGKVRLTNGTLVGLQYAGQNGHPYVAIGKVLKERGELETVTMQTIRAWLKDHPDQAQGVMEENPAYVYFSLADGKAYAKGALQLPLTPLRSIAVDDARAAYGVPTYIVTTRHDKQANAEVPLRRLFVSQDTGGALHGPHRTDIFFGRGVAEEWSAGLQNAQGDVYWLLPKRQSVP